MFLKVYLYEVQKQMKTSSLSQKSVDWLVKTFNTKGQNSIHRRASMSGTGLPAPPSGRPDQS